jgi:hypothetical protein
MSTKGPISSDDGNSSQSSVWETFLSQDYAAADPAALGPLLPGVVLIALAVVLFTHGAGWGWWKKTAEGKKTAVSVPASLPANGKKKRGAVCPFSAETDFIVEMAESMAPTPLDLFESWTDETSKDFGKPLGARWLNAGLSGQDTPGMLRAGLKRLPNAKFFLVEEPFRIREELLMKRAALEDPQRYPKVFVAEDDSLPAQTEVLDLFLSYLPRRYPDLYTYDISAGTLYVKPLDTTFVIDEWRTANRPLELCERIVQEDLVLMRPPRAESGDKSSPSQYEMAAAAVVFSFSELQAKLSQPVRFIHAPVPGYDKHLRRSLDLTFSKLLKVEQPMWRNNWGIAPTGRLDAPLYGSSEALDSRRMVATPTVEEIKAMFVKVEYQTIRRLPRTGYLLFTVKTMADPMYALEEVPLAAKCLAASIRGMSPDMRRYKGIENDAVCQAVLDYLDSIGSS